MECEYCKKTYSRVDSLRRHSCVSEEMHICRLCEKSWRRKDAYKRHLKSIHKNFLCEICGLTLETCVHITEPMKKKQKIHVEIPTSSGEKTVYYCCQQEFFDKARYRGHLRSQQHANANAQALGVTSYKILASEITDISMFLTNIKSNVCQLIKDFVTKHELHVKVQLELFGLYVTPEDKEQQTQLKSFDTEYEG